MSLDISLSNGGVELFEINVTHNLGKMARECDLYLAMWRPEELNVKLACELSPFLWKGVGILIANPERYKKFNPENGWGSYDGLLSAAVKYLAACNEYPEATISVSR